MEKSLSYLQVENAVIQSPLLTGNEKWLYVCLKSFRNRRSKRCFPSMRLVVERAGMSKNTAYKCRDKLKRLNLVDWEQGEGKKHSCYYRFLLEDGTEAEVGRILEVLKGNKLSKNRDSLNSLNEGHLSYPKRETKAVPNLGHRRFLPNNSGEVVSDQSRQENKLSKKEDTKHINQMNITNKGSDIESLPSSLSISEKKKDEALAYLRDGKYPHHIGAHVLRELPWPESEEEEALSLIDKIRERKDREGRERIAKQKQLLCGKGGLV